MSSDTEDYPPSKRLITHQLLNILVIVFSESSNTDNCDRVKFNEKKSIDADEDNREVVRENTLLFLFYTLVVHQNLVIFIL